MCCPFACFSAAVIPQSCLQVHEFGSVAGSYASESEVPASMDAVSTMEEERFIAAAVKGLAGSREGASLLAQHPQTLQGGFRQNSAVKDGCCSVITRQELA